MSSLLSLPPEDDLLRVDMTELELIPPSELYPREKKMEITALTTRRPVCSVWLVRSVKPLIPTVIPVMEKEQVTSAFTVELFHRNPRYHPRGLPSG